MTDIKKTFDDIVKKRRSVRIFDSNLPFDEGAVKRSLQRAILSPNSSNMQLWKFYRIQSKSALKTMHSICLNQQSVKTARELIVFVCPLHEWKHRCDYNIQAFLPQNGEGFTNPSQKKVYQYYKKMIPALYENDVFGIKGLFRKLYVTFLGLKKPMYREVMKSDVRVIAHKSCALAAQTFMLSMSCEGYASCPLEGFDSKRLLKFLKLPYGYEVNMVIAVGPKGKNGVFGEQRRISLDKLCNTL